MNWIRWSDSFRFIVKLQKQIPIFLEWQPCHSFAEAIDWFFFFWPLNSKAWPYGIKSYSNNFLYLNEWPIFVSVVNFCHYKYVLNNRSVFKGHQFYQIFIFYSYKFIPIQQIGCTAIPSIGINACLTFRLVYCESLRWT